MKLKTGVCLLFFTIVQGAYALAPKSDWKVSNSFGEVISYEMKGKDVELNSMSSEFGYADLTEQEMKGLKDLIVTKQEYGKMFGFADWKPTSQKLIEKNGERIVLINGTYKDAKKQTVNFIEVYWASKEKAGQYLITSNSLQLKIDNFADYLQ